MSNKYNFYLTGSIAVQEETTALREQASSVIRLPSGKEKQPDLLYMTSILVSTGTNLNNAHFLASELLLAESSIVNKALDIEHDESQIIGHQIQRAYRDKKGIELDLKALSSVETATLDSSNMDIEIASVVYKNRFPDISKEIAAGEWKVSMECYYQDFDVKIGDTILPRSMAEAIGLDVLNEETYGKFGKVIKNGKEIASGTVERVLRGICFSGCGIVKNPANPDSIIIETAAVKDADVTIIDLDLFKEHEEKAAEVTLNNVTSKDIEAEGEKEVSVTIDVPHVCEYYKNKFENKESATLVDDWCTNFSQVCTSPLKDPTDHECLKSKAIEAAVAYAEALLDRKCSDDVTAGSLERLVSALKKSIKF